MHIETFLLKQTSDLETVCVYFFSPEKRSKNKYICHIKTVSLGIVLKTRLDSSKETNRIVHRRIRFQTSSRVFISFNSICRVFFLMNSLKLYLCNLSFLTFFTSRWIRKEEEKEFIFISFQLVATHIARSFIRLSKAFVFSSFRSFSSLLTFVREILNIVMICFVTFSSDWNFQVKMIAWKIIFWCRMNEKEEEKWRRNTALKREVTSFEIDFKSLIFEGCFLLWAAKYKLSKFF